MSSPPGGRRISSVPLITRKKRRVCSPCSSRTSPLWTKRFLPWAATRAICAGLSLGNICSRRSGGMDADSGTTGIMVLMRVVLLKVFAAASPFAAILVLLFELRARRERASGAALLFGQFAGFYFIHVAPHPALSWLDGAHQRMPNTAIVFSCVFILGGIAAP